MTDHQHGSRVTRARATSVFRLTSRESVRWAARFGVVESQIWHDFVISHLLVALSRHADRFVFYGGTALSRTFLPDLRLSEDIDLLSVGPRRGVAALLDDAISAGLEPGFGPVTADPWLAGTRRDTDACIFHIAGMDVKVQLIDGTDYTAWPTQASVIETRYPGLPECTLTTLTAAGFVCAKTTAWAEPTRNAPRDLYDLWALHQHGHINPDAARLFKRHGPTGDYLRSWLLPARPPDEQAWQAALRNQCIPQTTAADAHDAVTRAWRTAVEQAEDNQPPSSESGLRATPRTRHPSPHLNPTD